MLVQVTSAKLDPVGYRKMDQAPTKHFPVYFGFLLVRNQLGLRNAGFVRVKDGTIELHGSISLPTWRRWIVWAIVFVFAVVLLTGGHAVFDELMLFAMFPAAIIAALAEHLLAVKGKDLALDPCFVKDIERFGRMIRFVVTSDGKTLRMQFRCETTAKATELEETLLRFVNSVCDRAPLAP